MATIDPRTEERLRQGFKKYLNPFMLTMWRLLLGSSDSLFGFAPHQSLTRYQPVRQYQIVVYQMSAFDPEPTFSQFTV